MDILGIANIADIINITDIATDITDIVIDITGIVINIIDIVNIAGIVD